MIVMASESTLCNIKFSIYMKINMYLTVPKAPFYPNTTMSTVKAREQFRNPKNIWVYRVMEERSSNYTGVTMLPSYTSSIH